MPSVNVNGADLWYADSGGAAEPVVFAHGFLMDHRMFDAQVRELQLSHRCVRYDHRGQGRSEITRAGYDIDSLAADAAALIRSLGCVPCHFAGLSMGGFVGLRLAINEPELLRSLVLIGSSADPEPAPSRKRYARMARAARWLGFRPLLGPIARIMFGRSSLGDSDTQQTIGQWKSDLLAAGKTGILRAVSGVLGREGVHHRLGDITLPTLIVVGDEDQATPIGQARRLRDGIRGSRLVVVPGAGHSATLEQPAAVTAAMREFLSEVAG